MAQEDFYAIEHAKSSMGRYGNIKLTQGESTDKFVSAIYGNAEGDSVVSFDNANQINQGDESQTGIRIKSGGSFPGDLKNVECTSGEVICILSSKNYD